MAEAESRLAECSLGAEALLVALAASPHYCSRPVKSWLLSPPGSAACHSCHLTVPASGSSFFECVLGAAVRILFPTWLSSSYTIAQEIRMREPSGCQLRKARWLLRPPGPPSCVSVDPWFSSAPLLQVCARLALGEWGPVPGPAALWAPGPELGLAFPGLPGSAAAAQGCQLFTEVWPTAQCQTALVLDFRPTPV